MGLNESAVLSVSRNRGGAPHQLVRLLKDLEPDDAATLRRILSLPRDEVNHAQLRRELIAINPRFAFSASTLRRWNEEFGLTPERFNVA